jgi:hypothetical protein
MSMKTRLHRGALPLALAASLTGCANAEQPVPTPVSAEQATIIDTARRLAEQTVNDSIASSEAYTLKTNPEDNSTTLLHSLGTASTQEFVSVVFAAASPNQATTDPALLRAITISQAADCHGSDPATGGPFCATVNEAAIYAPGSANNKDTQGGWYAESTQTEYELAGDTVNTLHQVAANSVEGIITSPDTPAPTDATTAILDTAQTALAAITE